MLGELWVSKNVGTSQNAMLSVKAGVLLTIKKGWGSKTYAVIAGWTSWARLG